MNNQQYALNLVRAASDHSGIDMSVIVGRAKPIHVCHARWACWLAMRKRGMTYADIGNLFQRNHATILYGIESANRHQGKRENDFRELCRIVANVTTQTNQPK